MLTSSTKPTVLHAKSLPRTTYLAQVTFRYRTGTVGLSMELFRLLKVEDSRRVAFAVGKGGMYVTRVNKEGFWINTTSREPHGVCSAAIASKTLCEQMRQHLGDEPGSVIIVPIGTFPVMADEIGLDPEEYPYPFYRLIEDQKSVKK